MDILKQHTEFQNQKKQHQEFQRESANARRKKRNELKNKEILKQMKKRAKLHSDLEDKLNTSLFQDKLKIIKQSNISDLRKGFQHWKAYRTPDEIQKQGFKKMFDVIDSKHLKTGLDKWKKNIRTIEDDVRTKEQSFNKLNNMMESKQLQKGLNKWKDLTKKERPKKTYKSMMQLMKEGVDTFTLQNKDTYPFGDESRSEGESKLTGESISEGESNPEPSQKSESGSESKQVGPTEKSAIEKIGEVDFGRFGRHDDYHSHRHRHNRERYRGRIHGHVREYDFHYP